MHNQVSAVESIEDKDKTTRYERTCFDLSVCLYDGTQSTFPVSAGISKLANILGFSILSVAGFAEEIRRLFSPEYKYEACEMAPFRRTNFILSRSLSDDLGIV